MKFVPSNRHILVSLIDTEEAEDDNIAIVLPEAYEKPQSPYALCEVLENAPDCKLWPETGSQIVVERRMLHKIEINQKTFYLILENYVFGRIKDET